MDNKWKILAATHVAALLVGYNVAPRELLDTEVRQSGLFTTDTMKVLSATVRSLKAENKLLVYTYVGDTRVTVSRSKLWVFRGHQELIVPANVPYVLDMGDLGLEDIQFDEKTKIVRVNLPRIKLGDIAFQPEQARTTNGGLLTWSQEEVDELTRLNYATARRSFTKQAQGAEIVEQARRRAQENIKNYFEIPLRIVGQPDVRVVADFPT